MRVMSKEGFSLKLILLMVTVVVISMTAVPVFGQSFELSDGIALFQNGEYDKAVPQLEQAIAKNPYSIEAYYYLAASQIGLKEYNEVLSTADKALEIAPENVQMLVVKAEALYNLDYPKAIPIYQKIAELAAKEGEDVVNRDQARAYLGYLYKRKANDAFLSGKTAEAVRDYKRARNLIPDSLTVHNNLSYILIQQERWEEAQEAIEIGLETFPTNAQLLFLKGQAYRGSGDQEEMLQAFKVLYEVYPENINYGIIYGQALMAANQARKANEHMRQLINKHPENEEIYEALKTMSEQRFDVGSKKNVLKLQRKAFPDNQLVALELADTHVLLKEYEEARVIFDSLYTSDPTPEMALRSARTYTYDGIDDKALEAYRQVVNEWADDFDVMFETAIVMREGGQKRAALRLFKNAYALKDDPRIAVHIIELLNRVDNIPGEQFIHDLKSSTYYALGHYFELKYLSSKNEPSDQTDLFVSSIIGLLDLYSESSSTVSTEAENVLEGEVSPMPEILQEKQFSDKLSTYVDDWYQLLSERYSAEWQMTVIDQALQEFPGSSRLLYFKGISAFESDNYHEAQDLFEEAIRYGAKDTDIYIKLGDIHSLKKKHDHAILSYERSLSINNKNEEAYSKIISEAERSNSINEVIDRWLLRYETNSKNKVLKEYLIAALHKADRFEEARRVIEED